MKSFRLYQRAVIAAGALLVLLCARRVTPAELDLRFLLLFLVTVGVSSRVAIKIPRHDSNITLSDAFILLVVLIYGGGAGVLLAAADGLSSGLRISRLKKPSTVLFNGAVMACSTAAAAGALWLAGGGARDFWRHDYGTLAFAACTLGLAQFAANSGLIAVGIALKTAQPVFQAWSRHCAWLSISTFAGAFSACAIANFIDSAGFYALLVAVPTLGLVYFTYNKYLEDIKAAAAQAEAAERARAGAERERAELAERHVEEQQRYIAELERVSRELQESREHFRHAAFHDSLTALPNRTLLADHLRLAIERSRRRPEHLFAVLFLDLDRFKNINDSLGHAAGDRLLVETARRLELCSRPTDTVARLGGDEFAVLLDGLESDVDAVRVAGRVQEELMRPFHLGGHEVYTAASIGITLSTHGYEDPENVLRDADTAMYRAKEKGKARYELFDAEMHADALARLRLENDLRRAVEHREFEVYYQPVITLATGKLSGFEALVRWRHPERGIVSPAEFIPLAEETRLITEIGAWVLTEACRQMSEWRELIPSQQHLTVSVNLSSKQLTRPGLPDLVRRTLGETGLPPHCLKLEITESAVMDNAESAASLLAQLRALGIQLSIDDFGTGYSSLSYLHRFPVDTLKIDRSFVAKMTDNSENGEIVRTIVTLASNLGMCVVAEGVETEEQHARLEALGCEYAQGFLYSRPVEAESALALIRRGVRPALTHTLTADGTDRSLFRLTQVLAA
ncbi:MAG TPA: EAL domain-containing protein [Pyrinomonadaceae bacterium]|nr:EAL domain-containing protein [Pyrinomonadaceae bacterium]